MAGGRERLEYKRSVMASEAAASAAASSDCREADEFSQGRGKVSGWVSQLEEDVHPVAWEMVWFPMPDLDRDYWYKVEFIFE